MTLGTSVCVLLEKIFFLFSSFFPEFFPSNSHFSPKEGEISYKRGKFPTKEGKFPTKGEISLQKGNTGSNQGIWYQLRYLGTSAGTGTGAALVKIQNTHHYFT